MKNAPMSPLHAGELVVSTSQPHDLAKNIGRFRLPVTSTSKGVPYRSPSLLYAKLFRSPTRPTPNKAGGIMHHAFMRELSEAYHCVPEVIQYSSMPYDVRRLNRARDARKRRRVRCDIHTSMFGTLHELPGESPCQSGSTFNGPTWAGARNV